MISTPCLATGGHFLIGKFVNWEIGKLTIHDSRFSTHHSPCRFTIDDCSLPIANCLPTVALAKEGLLSIVSPIAYCQLPIAHCLLSFLHTKLNQHPIRILGMKKADHLIIG